MMDPLDGLFLTGLDIVMWAYCYVRVWFQVIGGQFGSELQIAALAIGFIFCWLIWTAGQLLQWSPKRVAVT